MNKQKEQPEKIDLLAVIFNKYYKLIIVFLSLAILGTAFFGWLRPKYLDVRQLTTQKIPAREKRLAQLTTYYNGLVKLSQHLDIIQQEQQSDFEKIKKILPNRAEIDNLFAQMESLIQASGYDLNSVSFSAPIIKGTAPSSLEQPPSTSASKIGVVDIDLTIQGGGYEEFKNLLANIERHLRIMDVSSINFSDVNVDEEAGEKASYTLSLRTYYLP